MGGDHGRVPVGVGEGHEDVVEVADVVLFERVYEDGHGGWRWLIAACGLW